MITSAVFMCVTSRFHNSIILTNKSIKNSPVGTAPVFETGVKTPFKQPIADSLSVIGCLVWFEYEYCYNNECIL
ncbi:hypothetical protein SB21_19270 [Bacillus velezensis]|nr:hypothetical protein SB21_19270 [Bacillus velezensis]